MKFFLIEYNGCYPSQNSQSTVDKDDIVIDDKTPAYYHPGKSGGVYQNKNEKKALAYFFPAQ